MQALTPSSRRRSFLGLVRVRLLALLVLLFSTPGSAELIHDVIAFATGVACCEDCGPSETPEPCAHCVCCSHASAVPASFVRIPAGPAPRMLTFGAFPESDCSSGYRAPPFRPPSASA